MKQDFPAKSFSLPTLFTVEDIILLFISYLMIIEYTCINTRREITCQIWHTTFVLLAFRLKTKQNYRLLTDWRVRIPYSNNIHIYTCWCQYKTIFTIILFWNVQIKNYVHYIHTLYQKIALLQLYNFKEFAL